MLKLQLYATVMVTLMLSQIGTSKLFLASLMAKRTSATRLILLVTEHKINSKKYYYGTALLKSRIIKYKSI